MADDLTDSIAANALKPRRASGDTGSVEANSIPDQIEADRYAKSVAASKSRSGPGVRFFGMIPPGAGGVDLERNT